MSQLWSRRRLLGAATTAACAALSSRLPALPPRAARVPAVPSLRIGVVVPASHGSLRQGVALGAAEARHAAQLLGGALEVVTVPDDAPGADVARTLVAEHGATALIGGVDDAAAAALADAAAALGVPFLNALATGDALRGERCGATTFHVQASDRMYRDARALAPADALGVAVRLWHPSLERYGAAQLNDRFRAHAGAAMDGAAWAGWMAVKVLWESAARARVAEPRALVAALAAGQFDGHKGRSLSFRPWDRQMRQPLYLVPGAAAGDAPVRDVPVPEPGERVSARALLDRLGASPAESACRTEGA